MPGLTEYRAKRDFSKTAEPQGGDAGTKTEAGGIFVVHKHAATRLHYDLRLEHGGVLWSWAVTRGPSLDPRQKRLAVHVEDHPLDYAPFEGTIPEGEYGGGAVIVWDEGRWVPQGDPGKGMETGRLTFTLEGRKLHGAWHLVRMRKRKGDKRDNWLLIKDEDAAAREDGDILQEAPASIRSGRTVEEVGGHPAPAASGKTPARQGRTSAAGSARKAASDKKPARSGQAKSGKAGAGPVALSHPEKLLWPDAGMTKQDLFDHYEKVWKRLKPFLMERPLTLVRAPDGKKRFFQQHAWAGMPANIHTVRDPADGAELLFVGDFDGLAALVQFGTVEIHGWGAKRDALTLPDQVTFDLDPDDGMDAQALRSAALEIRARFEAAAMTSFVKTSGGKGFHITAPLTPGADWDVVERFARGLAHAMAADAPDRFTVSSLKAEREGRIYVDYLRNNANATTVLPWSSRAKPAATVSVPVTRNALENGVGPADFTLGSDALKTALRLGDAWADFWNAAKPLEG